MASSNRHWPSMFKSKPCDTQHHQRQHDLSSSLTSSGCNITPYSSVSGCEERSPEPKPRWNPKPEQIHILEAIFNSGMVNPPRDEIRKIRSQLQVYGQVGDANVFYWFQNRKSRTKHKQHRHLQTTKYYSSPVITSTNASATVITASSSSIPSSDKSSPTSADKSFSVAPTNLIELTDCPATSVNQTYLQTPHGDFLPEPFFYPVQQQHTTAAAAFTQGFCFPEISSSNFVHVSHQTDGNCSGILLSDLLTMNHGPSKKFEEEKIMKLQQELSYTVGTAPTITHSVVPHTVIVPSTISHNQGTSESGATSPEKSMVFINDVAFEVAVGPFNVREAFGDEAVLVHSSGQPVLINECGVTFQSLQHGGFYYLL